MPKIVDFRDVSIRGRVGLATYCLEHCICLEDVDDKQMWQFVIDQCWEYTGLSLDEMATWEDRMVNILPSVVLNDEYAQLEQCEFSVSTFLAIRAAYAAVRRPKILEIIECIRSAGIAHFYVGFDGFSPLTLEGEVADVRRICAVLGFEVSLTSADFLQFGDGWGQPFDRAQFRQHAITTTI